MYGKIAGAPRNASGLRGGMAERLKAHVLKTCLGHTNVGSNPTPSANQLTKSLVRCPAALKRRNRKFDRRLGEVPEWLNGLAC